MRRLFFSVAAVLLTFHGLLAQQPAVESPASVQQPPVKKDAIGETVNVHSCGNLFLAGQFTPDDIGAIKSRGIQRVITLRQKGEVLWDEKAAVEKAGVEFIQIPLGGPETLTDDVLQRLRSLLGDAKTPTMLHCGSANRVGGVWMAYRTLDQGVPVETALAEAKQVGLRSRANETRVKEYIAAELAKPKSVRPGINKNFLDANLDIEQWLGRFEVESREVFAARDAVLAACNLKSGMQIADVGAGTGLYTRLFSNAVGDTGQVYAVDISPAFIAHLKEQVSESGRKNITVNQCGEDSVKLPAESVHLAFVCDTYHHFEFPEQTVRSIHDALKPGGELIVIDFERIEGKSREWTMNHVRAGKDVFRSEIESIGFGLVEEVKIDGFKENYFLRFKKQ